MNLIALKWSTHLHGLNLGLFYNEKTYNNLISFEFLCCLFANFVSLIEPIIHVGDACKGDVVMFEQNIYRR